MNKKYAEESKNREEAAASLKIDDDFNFGAESVPHAPDTLEAEEVVSITEKTSKTCDSIPLSHEKTPGLGGSERIDDLKIHQQMKQLPKRKKPVSIFLRFY